MTSTFLMRAALAVALLTAPIAAFADFQGTATTAVRPPLADSAMANPNAYNVIAATGNATTDYANLTAAFATSTTRTVHLMPGTFQVCQPGLTIPEKGVVIGQEISGWNNNGNNYGPGRAVLTCSTTGSFAGNDAFLIMHSRSTLSGVTIHGLADLNPGLTTSCIRIRNEVAVIIEKNDLQKCYDGIDMFSDAAVLGSSGWPYSQLALIRGNYITGNQHYGIYGSSANGGFIADVVIDGNNIMFNQVEQIHLDSAFTNQIMNNRIEDGFMGINFSGCCTQITGNIIDRMTPGIHINASNDVIISGNEIHGYPPSEGGPTCCGIIFDGSNGGIDVGPNHFLTEIADYQVVSGSTVDGKFYGAQSYLDANTSGWIAPLVQTLKPRGFQSVTLTGSAFASTNLQVRQNISMALVASACPCSIPNPTGLVDGSTGTIAIAQDPLAADTVTWGTAFAGTTPTLSTTPGDVDYIPYVIASGKVVRGPKSTAGAPANILTGGNGMTSGWSIEHGTLTNAVGTDPIGGSAASRLQENTETIGHRIGQALTDNGSSRTCSVYIHAGTSGTRNLMFIVWDASFNEYAWADFAQNGTNTGSGANLGTVSNITSSSAGGGWTKVGATFDLNSSMAWLYLWMDNGTNAYLPSYTGDNTSNIWLWGPDCH